MFQLLHDDREAANNGFQLRCQRKHLLVVGESHHSSGGRPFCVVPAGDSVALTAKALGGTATMMFQPDMARRVGMVLCKVSQQVAEQLQAGQE